MEKHYDVIRELLDLKDTGLDGLEHVRRKVSEGKFEETVSLFLDMVHAFATMEQSISSLPDKMERKELNQITEKVRDGFDLVVQAYEKADRGKVFEIIQFTLLPSYKNWSKQLDEIFQPYVLS